MRDHLWLVDALAFKQSVSTRAAPDGEVADPPLHWRVTLQSAALSQVFQREAAKGTSHHMLNVRPVKSTSYIKFEKSPLLDRWEEFSIYAWRRYWLE